MSRTDDGFTGFNVSDDMQEIDRDLDPMPRGNEGDDRGVGHRPNEPAARGQGRGRDRVKIAQELVHLRRSWADMKSARGWLGGSEGELGTGIRGRPPGLPELRQVGWFGRNAIRCPTRFCAAGAQTGERPPSRGGSSALDGSESEELKRPAPMLGCHVGMTVETARRH